MNHGETKIAGILGAVLAGGNSRRLGRDKALIEIDGRCLVDRAVATLAAVFAETVVIAPARKAYAGMEGIVIPDLRPSLGPVGGLHTALAHGGGRAVFLLACDMPRVTADVVRWLIESGRAAQRQPDSVPWVRVPRDAAGLQPLCALYSGSCLGAVEAALEAGQLSARELLERLTTEVVEPGPEVAWYSPELFASVNVPADVQRLAQSWSRVR